MTFKRLLGTAIAVCAVAVLVGSVGAGATRAPAKHAVGLSTNGGVREYLVSHGISPRGVVIQRGARNYAGPRCPGKRWTCTRSHRVIQIATGRGSNRFRCSRAHCVVVQVTKSALAASTARCIKTTGITQSCSITQTGSGPNTAIVVEIATKTSGLTQNASQTAQIVQSASGGSNTACVLQRTTIDGSTVARRGVPVTVTLDAHQAISITQDSPSGGNTAKGATTTGGCGSDTLEQSQALSSTATGTMGITQNENAAPNGPNMLLDVEQNQSPGVFGSASGENHVTFNQTNTLTAVAVTPVGPVNQTQSSDGGGIQAKVNQFSHDRSTADATQNETQCVHAQIGGTPTCTRGSTPSYTLNQQQFGPASVWNSGSDRGSRSRGFHLLRKGGCCSVQADNPNDVFTINQGSTQNADNGATQTNTVQGDCSTSGTAGCGVTQTTTVQGETTTNTQTAQTVSTGITCSGTTCETAPPIVFDGSPGTNAPPSTLGPYTMTPFGPDPQPVCPNSGSIVTGVSDPAGTIGFTPALRHDKATIACWATWSHGYTGDVYDNASAADPTQITITLPAATRAFYLYAEPNVFDVFNVTATAQDGTTSGPIPVQGNSGAKYFGFYATGTLDLASITVTTTADARGFAVGEFGISTATPPPIP
jgi:hypothetical protein